MEALKLAAVGLLLGGVIVAATLAAWVIGKVFGALPRALKRRKKNVPA